MKTTDKVLVFRDEKRINETRALVESALPLCQEMIDAANEIGIELTTESMSKCMNDPEAWAKGILSSGVEEKPEINGLRIKRAVMVDLLELPDASEFAMKVRKFQKHTGQNSVSLVFIEIKKGRAIVNESEFTLFAEQLTIYARTPKEIETWAAYQKLTDALNGFNDVMRKHTGEKLSINLVNLKMYYSFDGFGDDLKFTPKIHNWKNANQY